MEILKPIGRWCMSGIGFTLAFLAALAIGILILTLVLAISERIRLFAIGGSAFMVPSLIYIMANDRELLEQQWIAVPLLAILFAWAMYLSYLLEESYFSFIDTVIDGIRVWFYGLMIFGLACTIFMIPLLFITLDNLPDRYR